MNRSMLGALLAGVLLSGGARAQAPEDEWGGYQPAQPPPPREPSQPVLPPPPPPPALAPAPTPFSSEVRSSQPVRPRAEVLNRVRLKEERNQVSMNGAPSLGAGKRGQMVTVGFPYISVRLLFGLGERFDLGVGYDTYYFLMNEPRAVLRFGLVKGENWSLSATLEGGYAFFAQRASREAGGPRFLTGRRNINVSPSLAVAYQGSGPRAARLFLSAYYLLALDTEPFATSPLAGVPPAIVDGHNGGFKAGAELPLSPRTAFVFSFGLDMHGRADDIPVLPSASVGLVTSL